MGDAIFCPIAIERECRIKPTVLSEMRARRSIGVQNEINCILEEIELLKMISLYLWKMVWMKVLPLIRGLSVNANIKVSHLAAKRS